MDVVAAVGCYATTHTLSAVEQVKIPALEFAGMTITTREENAYKRFKCSACFHV